MHGLFKLFALAFRENRLHSKEVRHVLENNGTHKARYVMIGGFLGAGKTTTIAKLARILSDEGWRVGLITNDQGSNLVDTAMLRSHGFETAEISGGCFCCRFNSLVEAADALKDKNAPDVFIAEPVGSCTDLVATVTYPLRRIYGDQFEIAPLSVMVDPIRAMQVMGLRDGRRFSSKVNYIYAKQLEEADILVINKIETLSSTERTELELALNSRFPGKQVLAVSAREGTGLGEWFDQLKTGSQQSGRTMDIDYKLYAEGEALLGWLNATVQLKSAHPFDGNTWIEDLAAAIQDQLSTENGEIAHLKMTLNPERGLGEIAVINLVRNDLIPELSQTLPVAIHGAQLVINLRAEMDPDTLKATLVQALATAIRTHPQVKADLEHVEHFRPGKPEPTHRMSAPVES